MEQLVQGFDKDLLPGYWFREYEDLKQAGIVNMDDLQEVSLNTTLSVEIVKHIKKYYKKHKQMYG